MLFLQLCNGGGLLGHRDLQVAVAAAELIDHFLFLAGILHGQIVGQPEEAAHIGGLDLYQLIGGGILLQNGLEHIGVIQILGNGDVS